MRINRKILLLAALLCPVIVAAKNYKGAELRTKASYTYGRFEVRYKSAQREGVLASFFTYHDGDVSANWNEIDIEILGRYTNDVQFNTITAGQTNHVRHQAAPFNPHTDFHTYAIEWTPEYIAWSMDGVEAYRQTAEHVATINKSQKIMMNIWNPVYTGWVGTWNEDVLPAFAYYDWVSYASYTPGAGNTGSNNNFTLQWTDNFDSWDRARWDKATHTFNGNNCDFIPQNAVFQNGMMILCLTDTTNLGYVDRNPPVVKWARLAGNNVTVMFSEEVEQATAERLASYNIPGATISTAQLLPDLRSASLETSGVDAIATPLLLVTGVRDRAASPNTVAVRAVSIIKEAPAVFPLKINVGGSQQGDFLADQQWSEKVEYGYLDGSNRQWPGNIDITNTEDDAIYRAERWGLVLYKARVPNGNYRLSLMMAENNFSESGKRIFDVFIEGNAAISNLDLLQRFGAHSAFTKIVDPVEVTDGILDVHFSAVIDQPLLNGLIIEPSTASGVGESKSEPDQFHLAQNYPNPFNGATIIRYTLASEERVQFQVLDLLGKVVHQKDLGPRPAGKNEFSWAAVNASGKPLHSGVYLYRIRGKESMAAKKLVLLK